MMAKQALAHTYLHTYLSRFLARGESPERHPRLRRDLAQFLYCIGQLTVCQPAHTSTQYMLACEDNAIEGSDGVFKKSKLSPSAQALKRAYNRERYAELKHKKNSALSYLVSVYILHHFILMNVQQTQVQQQDDHIHQVEKFYISKVVALVCNSPHNHNTILTTH